MVRQVLWLLVLSVSAFGQWRDLFPNGSMEDWQPVGDGIWKMRSDGVLTGVRPKVAAPHQAWLYTKAEYGEFDLKLEYFVRWAGNSGVSIRDKTRAEFACGDKHDGARTPSHEGYEIQILSSIYRQEKYPTGSIYLFEAATNVEQDDLDWNEMEIRSRKGKITVLVNGKKVAEHAGDPNRPKDGPIGLQLHDPKSFVMFRNVKLREIK